MDREQLKNELKSFQEKCAFENKPLNHIGLDEAYPGDSSTSYIVQVVAPWIKNIPVSVALDFLFDKLWETTSVEVRKNIFSIQIFDSSNDLHSLRTQYN
jgi:hypothetical protein